MSFDLTQITSPGSSLSTSYDGVWKQFTDYFADSLLGVQWIHWTWVAFWVSSIMIGGQLTVWLLEEGAKWTPFIQ